MLEIQALNPRSVRNIKGPAALQDVLGSPEGLGLKDTGNGPALWKGPMPGSNLGVEGA